MSHAVVLRDRLLMLVGRKDLRSETIAIGAELIAADARFNLCIADKKRVGEQIDLFQLADLYESLIESCAEALKEFDANQDEDTLQLKLRTARDRLQQEIGRLGSRSP